MPDMSSTEVVAYSTRDKNGWMLNLLEAPTYNYTTVIYKVNDKKMIPSGEIA